MLLFHLTKQVLEENSFYFIIIIFKDFIYLFMRDREREAETQAEGEAGSHREPYEGLSLRTLGSGPEPKAVA